MNYIIYIRYTGLKEIENVIIKNKINIKDLLNAIKKLHGETIDYINCLDVKNKKKNKEIFEIGDDESSKTEEVVNEFMSKIDKIDEELKQVNTLLEENKKKNDLILNK